MDEVKEIPGVPGYFVTSTGDVYSARVLLKDGSTKVNKLVPFLVSGYPRVALRIGTGHKRFTKYCFVHHLVLWAYVGVAQPGQECHHKDGNRTNNNLDNLAWVTRSENVTYAHIINGTARKTI